jgi:spore germination protein GerM
MKAVAGQRRRVALRRPLPIGSAALVLVVLAAVLAAGCGVPQDDAVRSIDDVPSGLTATTTSTTTTTIPQTTVPTTTTPPSTVPQTSTTSVVTSSAPPTTIPAAIALYFVMGDRLIKVVRRTEEPADAEALISLLVLGPFFDDDVPFARTAIEFGDIERVTVAGGIATVDLGAKFGDLPSAERRRAVSQLVMTLAGRPGVGPVRFRLNGQAIAVPRGNGSIAGRTVSRDDYVALVDDPTATTTTSVPTSAETVDSATPPS